MKWLLALIVLVLGVSILYFWAAGGIQKSGVEVAPIKTLSVSKENTRNENTRRKTLRLLTWNIGFAAGIGTLPEDFTWKEPGFFQRRLEQMGRLFRELDLDLVFLQEVDFDSKRSQYIDQLEVLAESGGFPYRAEAKTWNARYLPYPYWPPAGHFGRVVSGGGILSRFPLSEHRITRFEKHQQIPLYQRPLYPFRYFHDVRVDVNGRKIRVLNTHLEAFLRKVRMEQARQLVASVKEIQDFLILAGDFNTTPPEARKKHGFNDAEIDDYREDSTTDQLRSLKAFREIVSREEYPANEKGYFTFPSDNPNRRLDYIFVRSDVEILSRDFPDTGQLSDHRPVLVEISFR